MGVSKEDGKRNFVVYAERVATMGSDAKAGEGTAADFRVKGTTGYKDVKFTDKDANNLARVLVANASGKKIAETDGKEELVTPGDAAKLMAKAYDTIIGDKDPKKAFNNALNDGLDELAVRQAANAVGPIYRITTETKTDGNPPLTDYLGAAGTAFKTKLKVATENRVAVDAMVEKLPDEIKSKIDPEITVQIGRVLMKNPDLADKVKTANTQQDAVDALNAIKAKMPDTDEDAKKAKTALALITAPAAAQGQSTAVAQIPPAISTGRFL